MRLRRFIGSLGRRKVGQDSTGSQAPSALDTVAISPRYARLDNELFYMDKTMMVFGNAKKVVE